MEWGSVRGVVMDMDGVLWRGDMPLPGLHDIFERLRAANLPFALATNNSSKSPNDYIGKLASMGVNGVRASEIITSGTALVSHLRATYPAGTRIYVVGMDALQTMVRAAGFDVTAEGAQVVTVGAKFDLTYDILRTASLLIRGGADFIGTNTDATFPTPEGLIPGTGSILAALRTATDRDPLVMGKPNKPMFEAALRLLGTPPEATLMIGDRLTTDILGAQNAGLRAALVLTGVETRETIAVSGITPDAVYEGLPDMLADWGI